MRRLWTTKEKDFLKENYLQMDNVALGFHLNRHKNSIKMKLRRLNLHRPEALTNYFKSRPGALSGPWKGGITYDRVKYNKERQQKYPKRTKAQAKLASLIRSGKLIPEPCFQCEAITNIEGHHSDYNKPEEIVWLCKSCHRKHHNKLKDLNLEGTLNKEGE